MSTEQATSNQTTTIVKTINHAIAVAIIGLILTALGSAGIYLNTLETNQNAGVLGAGLGLLAAGISAMAVYAHAHQAQLEQAIESTISAAERANDAAVAANGHADAAEYSATQAITASQIAARSATDAARNATIAKLTTPSAEVTVPTTGEAGQKWPDGASGATTTSSMPGLNGASSDTGQPASSTNGQGGELTIGVPGTPTN